MKYTLIPWSYNALFLGIDPRRAGNNTITTPETRERQQKYRATMRAVLAKDQNQFVGIAYASADFQEQREPQPADGEPAPYEERCKSPHAPFQGLWLWGRRSLAITKRKRVAVMKEMGKIAQSLRSEGSINWGNITNDLDCIKHAKLL